MHTHHVTIDDDRLTKTYASWDRDEHRREWEALRMLHTAAPGLTPEPLETDFDQQPPQVVMSVLPGSPPEGVWSGDQLRSLGAGLEQLWSVPPGNIPPLPAVSLHHPPYWQTLLDADQRPAGGSAAAAFDAARAFLTGLRPSAIKDSIVRPVLGQGDPNRDNYLWDGERIRIVDFEDASASDVAFELANQVEHLANRNAGFEVLLEQFDIAPARLLLCRRLISCFWLRLLLPGNPAHTRNPPGTLEAQAERCLNLLGADSSPVQHRIWLVNESGEE